MQTEAINMRERYPGMRTKRCCEEASESSCLACCHSAEMGFSLGSLERLDKCRICSCSTIRMLMFPHKLFLLESREGIAGLVASFRNCFEAKIILPIVVTNVSCQQSTALIRNFQDIGIRGFEEH